MATLMRRASFFRSDFNIGNFLIKILGVHSKELGYQFKRIQATLSYVLIPGAADRIRGKMRPLNNISRGDIFLLHDLINSTDNHIAFPFRFSGVSGTINKPTIFEQARTFKKIQKESVKNLRDASPSQSAQKKERRSSGRIRDNRFNPIYRIACFHRTGNKRRTGGLATELRQSKSPFLSKGAFAQFISSFSRMRSAASRRLSAMMSGGEDNMDF